MGAFDEVAHITIPDPADPDAAAAFRRKWHWEPHEVVLIKGTVTVADQAYVTNQYGEASKKKKGDIEYTMGNGRFAILDRMIVDWTLLYQGNKAPITPAFIRKLPANYANPVLDIIDTLTVAMTEEEQDNFLNSANGHIVDASTSTNLSLTKL